MGIEIRYVGDKRRSRIILHSILSYKTGHTLLSNAQTTSPFGCLNNCYFNILSNFSGSPHTGPNPGFCFPYPSSFSILHFSNAILTYCFTANFGLETNMALRNDLLFFGIPKTLPRILGIGVGFRSCVFTWIAFCKSTGSKFSCIFSNNSLPFCV